MFLLTHMHRIDSNFLIKIADFGLSEDVYAKNYFRQGSSDEMVKLPVKWMAPESLTDGHFSEKSDVVSQYHWPPIPSTHRNSIKHALFMYPVVIWCHSVGDIQWRESPLCWNRPTHSHAAVGGWTENEKTYQCCLY